MVLLGRDASVLGVVGFGEKIPVVAGTGVGFGAKILLVVTEATGDVLVADEGGTGKLPNGLNRGGSSFEFSGKGFTFFPGLALAGLSRIFLKIFDVLEPVEFPFMFNRLLSLSSFSKISLVSSFSAFRLPFGAGDSVEPCAVDWGAGNEGTFGVEFPLVKD